MAKKIFILMGNPDAEGTLSSDLAAAYTDAARAAGHEVKRVNLGDLRFDPILHKGYRVIQELEPDLLALQADIRAADHFVLIYPLWWSGTPALLKGLFDRMWLPGFAFHFWKSGMGWDALLKGKTARVITLSKMHPLAIRFMFGDFGNEIGRAILGFAGFKVRHTEFGSSESLTERARAKVFAKVAALARKAK